MARVRLLAGDLSAVAGSAVYCEELALRLADRGHEVSLVCLKATSRLQETCWVIETGRSPNRDAPWIWRFAYYLDEYHCGRALKHATLPDADVAIGLEHMFLRSHKANWPHVPLVYVPLSLIAPIEVRSYKLTPLTKLLSVAKFEHLQRWALSRADVTVRFTRMSCQALDDHFGHRLSSNYAINPMPISIPQHPACPLNDGIVRFVTIGRMVESKNVELAIKKLVALRQYRWRFDIVGAGERLEATRSLVKSLGLQDKVFCQGRQPETSVWLRQADLFLFTSRLDNCPVAVLEAMSYGVPVLGMRPDGETYKSGIEELVQHERTGLLANDEDDFQRQLETAIADPQQLKTLGTAARRQALEQHTWDAHLDRFEQIVERISPRAGKSARSTFRLSRLPGLAQS